MFIKSAYTFGLLYIDLLTLLRKGSCVQFGTLAMLYYPDKSYKTALRMFRRELHLTRGLMTALNNVGYSGYPRLLTLSQVRVIEEFLGEP